MAEFRTWSVWELEQEEWYVERLRRRLAAMLRHAHETGEALNPIAFNPRYVTRDHGWRVILAKLIQRGSGYEQHRRVALAAYTRYLEERVRVVQEELRARRRSRASSTAAVQKAKGSGGDLAETLKHKAFISDA